MPEPSKKSPQEIAERRRQVYASMRLPEIKTEIQTLRSEYRTQPRFSSITDANAKGTAVRRRAYIVGRIASLTGERDALRHERKR